MKLGNRIVILIRLAGYEKVQDVTSVYDQEDSTQTAHILQRLGR